MIEKKNSVLFICIHKRVESIVFAVSIKFCGESGLTISKYIVNLRHYKYITDFLIKITFNFVSFFLANYTNRFKILCNSQETHED